MWRMWRNRRRAAQEREREELEEMQRRLSAMKGLVRQQEALITHLLGQLTNGQKS